MVYSNGYQEPCPHQNHQRQVEPTLDHPRVKETDEEKQRVYNLPKSTQNPQHWKKFKELRKTWKRKVFLTGQTRRIHHLLERNFGPTLSPKEKTMWALVL